MADEGTQATAAILAAEASDQQLKGMNGGGLAALIHGMAGIRRRV